MGFLKKKFKILIRHKLIGCNYNTWAAWVFIHPGHDVIIFIETADIYIFADVIENGMELVGQKKIQEYIQKPYSARHQTITLDFDRVSNCG